MAMFVEQLSYTPLFNVAPCAVTDPMVLKLSMPDQAEYFRLFQYFQYCDDRNKRNLGLTTFAKHLTLIHNFVAKGDIFDSIRGLVCGIHFGVDSLLINTSRLKRLMSRSKSCMNGCFQKLGYHVCRPSQDITTTLTQLVPRVDPAVFNPRQWCVRHVVESATVSFKPMVNIQFGELTIQSDSSPIDNMSLSSLLNKKPQLPSILWM